MVSILDSFRRVSTETDQAQYQVTEELFRLHEHNFDKMPVTVDVYVNDRKVGTQTKAFYHLQSY